MDTNPARPTGLACEAVQLPGPVLPEAELERLYAAELGPLSVGEFDSTVPGGYFKEVRGFGGRTVLPWVPLSARAHAICTRWLRVPGRGTPLRALRGLRGPGMTAGLPP
jgi:hypothetical protein